MKSKSVIFILLLSVMIIKAAQAEIWISVKTYDEVFIPGATIYVYDGSGTLVDQCVTAEAPIEQNGNAWVWMSGEPVNPSVNEAHIIGPLNYSTTYYFVIGGRYAEVKF
jgi:hypothetical protein